MSSLLKDIVVTLVRPFVCHSFFFFKLPFYFKQQPINVLEYDRWCSVDGTIIFTMEAKWGFKKTRRFRTKTWFPELLLHLQYSNQNILWKLFYWYQQEFWNISFHPETRMNGEDNEQWWGLKNDVFVYKKPLIPQIYLRI